MVARLFSRQWILKTLVVILMMAVMVRLGIWQLDRLHQRRALNARIEAQIHAPQLDLNQFAQAPGESLPSLTGMEYRSVSVHGSYDLSQTVALRNQVWKDDTGQNHLGVHLLIPFKIQNTSQSILVDAGWVPDDIYTSGKYASYIASGETTVQGVIRASQAHAFLLQSDPAWNGQRLAQFYTANISRINQQIPYPLLPVYVQVVPNGVTKDLPYPQALNLDLSDGPHLSYTIQWFSFALILGIGYFIFINRERFQKNERLIMFKESLRGER